MFTRVEDAVKYLRSVKKIVIPSKFTYFSHSTQAQVKDSEVTSSQAKYKKLWAEIPLDGFEVKSEMSFLSKVDRLEYVRQHQSFSSAPTEYTTVPGQQNFQIKVMMPRNNLSSEEFSQLGKDEEYLRKLKYEYRGLGDGRHPKLPGKTKILTIGFMNQDEMSGKDIPTVIGCREQDIIAYANEVERELKELESEGELVNSQLEMPDFNGVIKEPKELFVMGDNVYSKELEKHQKKGTEQEEASLSQNVQIVEQNKENVDVSDKETESDYQNQEQESEQINKSYDLKTLQNMIDSEFSIQEQIDQGRFRTIDQSRQRFQEGTVPIFFNIDGVTMVNGKVVYPKIDNSNAQMRTLEDIKRNCEEIAGSITRRIKSKYGNFLHYATEDYCKLEALDGIIPELEQRVEDLSLYEKHIGPFETTKRETTQVKKSGILGVFGAKENIIQIRDLSGLEMAEKKRNAEEKLKELLENSEISQQEYDSVSESVERLYYVYVPEKISQEDIDQAKEELGLTAQEKIDYNLVKAIKIAKTNNNSLEEDDELD